MEQRGKLMGVLALTGAFALLAGACSGSSAEPASAAAALSGSSSSGAQGGASSGSSSGGSSSSSGITPPEAPGSPIFGNLLTTKVACNWRVANGTPDASTPPGALRWGYLDLAAGYYQVILSPSFPVGTRFRFEGQYPAARNFSYQLYNGGSQELAELADYQIGPDAGSQSPFNGVNTLDTAVQPGGHYTLHLVFGAKPASPAANTIYLDPSQVSTLNQAVLVYRIYNAFAGISVAQHGGMPLPTVYQETSSGDVTLASMDTTLVCDAGIGARDTERRTFSAGSDIVNSQPQHPAPIPAQPVPAAPTFILRDSSGDILVNEDNRYMYAELSQTAGDLVLMRVRAPSFATQPGAGSDPQLRHWSLCENAMVSAETYSCVEDQDAVIDSGGFFNVVIAVASKRPPNATAQHGFNWLAYGTTNVGFPIFRHMLPSPDFTQSAFNVPAGATPQNIMGDYFPVATYCSNAVFAAHTQAGQTPAQVFAGCQVGQ